MFIDLHHHFVYGMDDGAQRFEDMKDMLLEAYRNGAELIVATPHATPGQEEFHRERFERHLEEARELCRMEGYELKLYPGCEILYTDDAVRLLEQGYIPSIAGGRHVLVEFLPETPYDRLKHAARMLGSVGYQPIFAHIERYECLRRDRNLEELHEEYQIIMQVNAGTVAHGGFFTRRWFYKVMRMGCVDLISSDAHNIESRRFRMRECYDALKKEYGKGVANELCHDRAKRILRV